jgi:hypothetical protein
MPYIDVQAISPDHGIKYLMGGGGYLGADAIAWQDQKLNGVVS